MKRKAVNVAGSLLSACRNQQVVIHDISEKGAGLMLYRPLKSKQALLRWDEQRVFCEVIWTEGQQAGICFKDIQPAQDEEPES